MSQEEEQTCRSLAIKCSVEEAPYVYVKARGKEDGAFVN